MDAGITTDIDGDLRPFGSGVDIGADEFVRLPPRVGTFEPNLGSGVVSQTVVFTTTYTDPNGYEEITLAFFFLDRAPPIASGGLAAAYVRPNMLWLVGAGFCRPGQPITLTTDYVTLDCQHSSVSGEGDTLTIRWHARPEQCFIGGCGWNYAVEVVMDSTGLSDVGLVGWWRLDPASGRAQGGRPVIRPTKADLKELMEEINAWRPRIGEP